MFTGIDVLCAMMFAFALGILFVCMCLHMAGDFARMRRHYDDPELDEALARHLIARRRILAQKEFRNG